MSELRYWIWLSSLAGVRPRVKTLLMEHYASPRAVYFARQGEYEELGGLNAREIEALEVKSLEPARRILELCQEKDISVITMQDAAYPRRLAAIYDPPLVLYVRGRLPSIDDSAVIAVVGTRKATPYGIKMATSLGYEITKCGGLIVSGLTKGVDAAAARGALRAGGSCIGILGCAIDSERDSSLLRDVETVGAVVSEYPPGAQGFSSYYRARNRVTAGLSIATVVVEAPEKSGALLFADEAISQGKEVFVVPANADSNMAAGSNALLKDGAQPVTCGWDVLSYFDNLFPGKVKEAGFSGLKIQQNMTVIEESSTKFDSDFEKIREPSRKKVVDKPVSVEYIDLQKQLASLSEAQLAIVSAMNGPDVHVDDIIERCGLSAAEVLSELTMLQIGGFIRQSPGKRFSLNIAK